MRAGFCRVDRNRHSHRAGGSVADFYGGKQITMVVGYGTDGGFDVYARLVRVMSIVFFLI